MEPFLPFLAATLVGCAVAVVGYYFAKRAGLGPLQAEYVKTLRDLNEGLDEKLRLMQEQLDNEKKLVAGLTARVGKMERTILDLTQENTDLKAALKAAADQRIVTLETENTRLRGSAP